MIKKSVFAMAMVGCFATATLFSVNNAEAKKNIGLSNQVDCYSASSGSEEGAWFYDCGDCTKVDGVASGATKICNV